MIILLFNIWGGLCESLNKHKNNFYLFIYLNVISTCWQDVGGQDRLRPYWNHYYTGAQAIVFIVDSNDRERLQLCKIELEEASVDEQLKVFCQW